MVLRLVGVVLLLSRVAVPRVASAQPAEQRQQRCATSIPSNIDAGLLAPDILMLLLRSETFRGQCERIAGDARVHVRLSLVSGVDAGGRAQTAMRRYHSGALFADVEILFGENYRELLAHEFEHVLEQIEGVDLRREAAAGRAWEIAAGTFETRRARLAGVQVWREAETAHAPAPALTPMR